MFRDSVTNMCALWLDSRVYYVMTVELMCDDIDF